MIMIIIMSNTLLSTLTKPKAPSKCLKNCDPDYHLIRQRVEVLVDGAHAPGFNSIIFIIVVMIIDIGIIIDIGLIMI